MLWNMTLDEVTMYQLGLIEMVSDQPRESLALTLRLAGLPNLEIAYVQGRLRGEQLLAGDIFDGNDI